HAFGGPVHTPDELVVGLLPTDQLTVGGFLDRVARSAAEPLIASSVGVSRPSPAAPRSSAGSRSASALAQVVSCSRPGRIWELHSGRTSSATRATTCTTTVCS